MTSRHLVDPELAGFLGVMGDFEVSAEVLPLLRAHPGLPVASPRSRPR